MRADALGVSADTAAASVARANSRLRDIVERFEARAAELEPHLDSPGVAEELLDEAQRALSEAIGVVDELRAELDGQAASLAGPTPAAPAPTAPAGFAPTPALGSGAGGASPMGPLSSPGGMHGIGLGDVAAFSPPEAAVPAPDAATFGEGVAVRLPDGSTALAPNMVAADAVRHALTQLGVPYQWGGTAPGVGLDCSGLTQWAYHEAGLEHSAAGPGAGHRCRDRRGVAASRRPRGVGRPCGDDRRERHHDRSRRPGETIADPNDERGTGFSGILAADRINLHGHGISSAHFMCPSKPSDVAMAEYRSR